MWYVNSNKAADICLSSTQNIMSVNTIRPGVSMCEYYKTACVSISTMHSDVKQCLGLWLPNSTNTQVSNQTSAEPSHTIGSFMTSDQTKDARSPKAP